MVTYEFGPYQLNLEMRQLLRNGEVLSVQTKTLQILHLLIENRGQPLSKEQIFQAIWPDQNLEDGNITQRIYMLRRVLGEYPETANAILTVPGVGYVFTPEVKKVEINPSSLLVQPPKKGEQPARMPEAQDEAAGQPTPAALMARPIWRRRGLMWVILLAASLLATSVGLLIRSRNSKSVPVIFPTTSLLTSLTGYVGFPAFSPDEKFAAFTWDGDSLNNKDIYIKLVNSGSIVRLTSSPKEDLHPVWSPNGEMLAFLRAPEVAGDKFHLLTIPALGGMEQQVARVWGGLDWSPDGRWLAVSDKEQQGMATGIWLVSVDGAEKQPISKPGSETYIVDRDPAFSPDGRQLAFVRWISEQMGELFVTTIGSGRLRQLTFDNKSVLTPKWSPDGSEIYFISNRNGRNHLWRIRPNGAKPELVESVTSEFYQIDISPRTARLAGSQWINETSIEVSSAGRQNAARCLIDSSRKDESPAISPDGRSIVFESARTGAIEIWGASIDCSRIFQVTRNSGGSLGSPRWSPDGEKIAFSRYYDGQAEIAIINRDGGGLRRLTDNSSSDFFPSWSRDGRFIYFTSNRSGTFQIYVMAVSGGEERLITAGEGSEASESFDGELLYFTRTRNLWTKNLRTGIEAPVVELADINVSQNWALTPQAIYYIPQRNNEFKLAYRLDLKTRRITTGDTRPANGFTPVTGISVSADETVIARTFLNFIRGDISLIENWRP